MKREFLKELGIEAEAIEKIMAENGADITREKNKLEAIEKERDSYKGKFEDVEAKLKDFEGVDVSELNNEIKKLNGDLKTASETHAKELENLRLSAETKEFLATKKFINKETASYYEQELNKALGDKANTGKNRDDLFKALTVDAEGNERTDIFVTEQKNPISIPASGDVKTGNQTVTEQVRAGLGLK